MAMLATEAAKVNATTVRRRRTHQATTARITKVLSSG
jgi:hypothetical protein